MYVVDASVWVSWLFTTDLMHAASRAWLKRTLEERILLFAPMLLLPEAAGAIARRSGDTNQGMQAAARLARLRSLQLAPLDSTLTESAYHAAAELRLRGSDAVYVALAQRLDIPLVTWDAQQRTRALQSIAALSPDEASLG